MDLFKCRATNTLILILILMEKAVLIEQRVINQKTYLVPQYNLYGCEKYMLPKLDNAPVHHTFFSKQDVDQLYKQKNIDPNDLQCNLKVTVQQRKKSQQISEHSRQVPQSLSNKTSVQSQKIKTKPRPKLRQTGYTHFIHIPLTEQIGQFFQNQIKPQIDAGDIDTLVDVNQLHATILVFRPKSLEDIPKWQKIVKSVNFKKAKVFIKGVDIFPIKKTFTRVFYLNINGLDDIIDTIVTKAIDQKLIQQKQLSHIYFDKASQTFKVQKQHVTVLKTKGDDLIDAASYLKLFGKVNVGKVNINKIAMSMIGSFDGKEYFNQFVHTWQ